MALNQAEKKLFLLFSEISRRKKGVKIAVFWLIFAEKRIFQSIIVNAQNVSRFYK